MMAKVVHFELPAGDMNKAKDFYSKVFGWKINAFDKKYFLAQTGPTDEKMMPQESGFINGGIYTKGKDGQATVLVLQVESIDDSVKAVLAAGGKLFREKYMIEHVGYYASVEDLDGNRIGLMEPRN